MGGRGEQAPYRDCRFGGFWLFGIGDGGGKGRAAGEGGVDCGGGGVEVGSWAGYVGCGGAEGKAWICEGWQRGCGGHWRMWYRGWFEGRICGGFFKNDARDFKD